MPAAVHRVIADLKTLPRQFWVLAAGIFVYLIGVEMTYPYETLYLNGRLGVSMTTLGVIIGVTLLATLPMQVVGGALCDKVGRRPVLIVAILGSMTLYFGLGLTRDLAVIVALIAFEAAFGWAQFITAEQRDDRRRHDDGAAHRGVQRLARRAERRHHDRPADRSAPARRWTPLPAQLLRLRHRLRRVPLMVIVLLRETRPATVETVSVTAPSAGTAAVLRDRRMLAFCLIALLPLYAFGQIWATMPVMLADLHGVTAQRWSVAMVVYGISMVILQYPVIRALARRATTCSSCRCPAWRMGAGVGSPRSSPGRGRSPASSSISLGIVLLIPIAATVVSRLAPVELRGRYMGVWTLVYMGGYALGPLLGGWALDALGGRIAFVAIAAACLLGAALFPLLRGACERGCDEADGAARLTEALGGELRGERPEQAV